MTHTLIPAYGRNPMTKAAVIALWNDGKDFANPNPHVAGSYANREDFERSGEDRVLIRYKHLTQIALLKRRKDGGWR